MSPKVHDIGLGAKLKVISINKLTENSIDKKYHSMNSKSPKNQILDVQKNVQSIAIAPRTLISHFEIIKTP